MNTIRAIPSWLRSWLGYVRKARGEDMLTPDRVDEYNQDGEIYSLVYSHAQSEKY